MTSTPLDAAPPRRLSRVGVALLFVALALAAIPFADLSISGHDPWRVVSLMAAGLLSPDFSALESLAHAGAATVSFALVGVACGAGAGLALAPFYRLRLVRGLCVAVRAIHELFWALVLMQVFGISATTGILALALPYAGIFAKVFSEYMEEGDRRPAEAMPPGASVLSVFFYARVPPVARELGVYTLYRLECGMRSSAVLGFIGLPTLGFQLDTFFRQGHYGAVAAVLILYYFLIATIRLWMRWRLSPLYLGAALWYLAGLSWPPMGSGALWRFLGHDIVPAPLRGGALGDAATWERFGSWLLDIVVGQGLPGLFATMLVAQMALVLAGLVAILAFPLIVPQLTGRIGSAFGHLGLVVGRSTPEYMLAYILVQVFGPSMLPAVVALGLHNGAIVAHLLGRQTEGLHGRLRVDAPRGLNLYAFEVLPRIYGSFLALLFYRWEIIVRESAILGLLGVATLGFYVDLAIGEIRLDRAMVLLALTVAATLCVDGVSRRLRAGLGIASLSSRAATARETT
ncbi:PhnE/PtxC family ABC transporter permease [Aureimonas populi]|uniref:PhnE/PtxC family ABC transporter permease n=1 Tax=Aureimonas populi TaxID=1701758 RepID=A0ABW5CL94_9HYPH|nr:ABC transporter permease [Aureimonas populi]